MGAPAMSACDRFEREGLLLLEQGKPLGPHFDTCQDCRAAGRAYQALVSGIAAPGPPAEPTPAWRARVWERIEADRHAGWHRWLAGGPIRVLAPLAAIGVVVAAVVWLAGEPGEVSLRSTVVAQGVGVRGEDAHPGDRLQLRAQTGGSMHAELRLYLNSTRLVLSCGLAPPCRVSGDVIQADFVLESVGEYQAVLFVSEQPLPPPTGNLDEDAGAALDAGARVEPGERIPVR